MREAQIKFGVTRVHNVTIHVGIQTEFKCFVTIEISAILNCGISYMVTRHAHDSVSCLQISH